MKASEAGDAPGVEAARVETERQQPADADVPLVDIYERWFRSALARTPEDRREAFRLRYQVYCIENPFEDPADNPNGEETDHYDNHSVHGLLIHRPSGVPHTHLITFWSVRSLSAV